MFYDRSFFFFCIEGYGDNPPKTTGGKAITMIYSFIGIPLMLMVLADFGKIFTRAIKFVVLWLRRLYYNQNLRGVRHLGRKATKTAQLQAKILVALNRVQRRPPFYIDPQTGNPTCVPPKQVDKEGRQPQVVLSPSTPSLTTPNTPMPTEILLQFSELDDEFNLPISLALSILFIYLLLGAIIFWSSEKWSLFHAFYFVFISMSTIGFGDFVPSKIHVLMYALIYLVFGLSLTSMCINVIQEKLSSSFEKARLTIGESIGLEPTTPITIVNPVERSKARKNSKQVNQATIE